MDLQVCYILWYILKKIRRLFRQHLFVSAYCGPGIFQDIETRHCLVNKTKCPSGGSLKFSGWGQTLQVKEELQIGSSAMKRNETGSWDTEQLERGGLGHACQRRRQLSRDWNEAKEVTVGSPRKEHSRQRGQQMEGKKEGQWAWWLQGRSCTQARSCRAR